jgi:2-keto-4-pentenoate hydratase/2-oxohepta-3-ene-1,7-dioic acid hydratase in catechol pathway
MKIIRYETPEGPIEFAALLQDGTARVIVGDYSGEFTISDKEATIARLLSPVTPSALLCIGLNYRRHAEETGGKVPLFPVLFIKNPGAVQHPGGPILLPRHLRSDEVDYECELAVVIGRNCKNVSRADALSYVAGYTCANDVSARDWQVRRSGGQWCRGKSFDTFAPLGPCLVTPDEIENPNALNIQTRLNGEVMQRSNTKDMIFDVPALIEFLSASTTLLAGTVILTGTPEGVGMARTPPVWLKAGDVVSVEIEKIGVLTNPVREEG